MTRVFPPPLRRAPTGLVPLAFTLTALALPRDRCWQVERVVPAYAARQISRVVATLRQPEDLFAVAPVDEARVLDTSHGWAQEGVLGGARRGSVSHARSAVPGSAHGMSVTMGGGSVRDQSVRGRRGMLAGSSIGTADNDSGSNRSVVDGPRPVFSWMPSAVSSPGQGTAVATALSVTGGGSVASAAPLHRLRAVAGMVASVRGVCGTRAPKCASLTRVRLPPVPPPCSFKAGAAVSTAQRRCWWVHDCRRHRRVQVCKEMARRFNLAPRSP